MPQNPLDHNRHVLVVGGAGYVGNVLVRRLLSAGVGVRVLDCLMFDHGAAIAPLFDNRAFSFVNGDLRDPAAVERSLDGITDVVLLAALVGDPLCKKFPEIAREVNADGARNLIDSLDGRGIGNFVFTSTCSNYGLRDTDEPATEEADLSPVSLYAETKVEIEQHLLSRRDEIDFCATPLRISTAHGLSARMRFDLTINEFAQAMAAGEDLLVYDADTWRPYAHVEDISKAIMTVMEADRDLVRGEVFNVGHSDQNYTKRMVVEAIQDALDGAGSVSYKEGGTDPRNYKVSFEKIRETLGFEPDYTVPHTIASICAAVQAGAYDDLAERDNFYGNRAVELGSSFTTGALNGAV